MLFFYIRHGDPIYTPDSLTPQGELQAAALAKRLALYGIDRIYVSSSVRAQQTAAPTAKLLGLEPETLDWATEHLTWKDFALKSPDHKKEHWVFQSAYFIRRFNSPEIRALGANWTSAPEFADTRFAEGIARIQKETDAFFASLGYVRDPVSGTYRVERPSGERIAFFAHQGFGLAFLSCILNDPYPHFCTHFDFGHSSMTVIEFREYDRENVDPVCVPRVLQFSNDSHLYREGLPTKFENRIFF
ncbi:MAG: histidine phosphatase family protein [Clostridia bacterium]|nr:histidine phosphatase family protein [Clostridia bacterium]